MGTNRIKQGSTGALVASESSRPDVRTDPSRPAGASTGALTPSGTSPLDGKPRKTPTGQLRMPPSRRRKQLRLRVVVKALVGMAILTGLASSAAAAGAFGYLDSLNPNSAVEFDLKRAAKEAANLAQGLTPLTERRTILLLGTDYAYAEGKRVPGAVRSDTMLVVGLDPASHKATVVSIPRDTRVSIRGHYDKINAALYQGGPELAAEVVSSLLGVPITHWAQVNTTGLERLVDTLGGVRMFVERDMHYVDHTAHLDIDIRKGWHLMGGAEAHQYVRFRHDELGDIGRVQRQQQFLRAATDSLLAPETLWKAPRLLGTIQDNVTTNLKGADLLQVGIWAARMNRADIRMVMLPGEFSAEQYAASYWLVDPQASQAIGRRLLGGVDALAPLERAKVKVTVLNGTARLGLATAAARELREAGWNVWSVGDAARRDVELTRVIAQTGRGEWVATLAKDLGLDAERVDASVGDLTTDFTVIVGDDYASEVGLGATR